MGSLGTIVFFFSAPLNEKELKKASNSMELTWDACVEQKASVPEANSAQEVQEKIGDEFVCQENH